MLILSKLTKIINHLTDALAIVGMVILMLAILITVSDVLIRSFLGNSISGVVDLSQLAVMFAAFYSIPYAFKENSHVFVSLFTDNFSQLSRRFWALVADVFASGLMVLIVWFSFQQALLEISYGDVSNTIGIPKMYYWIPLLSGMGLAAIICICKVIISLFLFLNPAKEVLHGD